MFTCTLNPDARENLCDQLYGALREEILSGRLTGGSKLPSKRELSLHLRISTSTVEAAYGRLTEEGYCESRPRSGVYVASRLPGERPPEKPETPVQWDFGTGAADAARFPYATWAHLMREVLSEESGALLTAGDPRGSEGLRRETAAMLHRMRGIDVPPEEIVFGAGTEVLVSELLALIGREKRFAVEDPGYPRVRRILAAGGSRIVPIPLESGAPDLRALYASGAGAVYVTPSHQFPTGHEMDASRREALLCWARETGGYILEDDYDSEFRFSGEHIPAMRAQDPRVIYMNTFSRTLASGLRMSFMTLPPALVGRFLETHSTCSVPAFEQETLRKFMAGGFMERHIARMRTVYRARLQALEEGVAREGVGRLRPCATGLYALLEAGGSVPAGELVSRAAAAGVKLTRAADYSIMEVSPQDRTVLLGFAGLDESQISEGLHALAAAWGIRRGKNP